MSLLRSVQMCFDYAQEKWAWTRRNSEEDESIEGKVILVTGANAGLGKATALKLAERGATVVLGCRNVSKGNAAADEIKLETGNKNLVVMKLDLGSTRKIRDFVIEFEKRFSHLHVLINNAGVYGVKRGREKVEVTEDGFESHFGVNYLGHFLLTRLLLPILRKSQPSRIINVSSAMYLVSNLDLNDLMLRKVSSTGPWAHLGYSNSKLALILFTKVLARKVAESEVRTYALCPGIVDTQMHENQETLLSILLDKLIVYFFGFCAIDGCETILHCALSKITSKDSGKMYRFNKEWALDSGLVTEELANALWDKSSELLGLANAV